MLVVLLLLQKLLLVLVLLMLMLLGRDVVTVLGESVRGREVLVILSEGEKIGHDRQGFCQLKGWFGELKEW